ncbi:MAG: hypothetical protein EKK37_05635 [Sphingobacteriales bacterium]|nr:MAG: hypothetical protein EKK37_05635 [Sphingobacteriales bacterium]
MKKLFLFLPVVMLFLQLISCSGSKLGYAANDEKLEMQVKEKRDVIDYNKLSAQRIPDFKRRMAQRIPDSSIGNPNAQHALPFAPILGGLVSLATNGVKKMIDNDKKKYTAGYDFALTKLYFYDQLSTESMFDPLGMQFHGFTLVRTFKTADGKEDTALKATFVLDTANEYEIINNAVFRLRLKDIDIRYAKAKIAKTAKQNINMDMEISFYSSYVNEMGQLFDNVLLGKFYLLLREVPLDKSAQGYAEYYQKLRGNLLDGRSFIVPRSFGYYLTGNGDRAKCYSQGAYSIHVKVNESSKNTFVNKIIIDNSTQILNSAESGLKKLINE